MPADNPAQVVAGLMALGDAMVEQPAGPAEALQATNNSTIPAIYTYWGQFIDHDLTANTDRNNDISIIEPDLKPLPPADVVRDLKNLRQPTLNLDSVYGDGPTFDDDHPTEAAAFYDGIKFRLGSCADEGGSIDPEEPTIGGVRIPPDADLARDLFRDNLKAQIADARNDENLIIAQLHTAYLRFHNAVVDWVEANEPKNCASAKETFERARQLTRWHYQWLVLHDYLKTVALPGIVDKVLLAGPKHYPVPSKSAFMPLEFSVAAFRFGHTMVRAAYDHNRNFGRAGKVTAPAEPNVPLIPNAPFNFLFTFTGGGFPKPFRGQTDRLPFNWIIEWDRFVDKGDAIPDHFARKIDTLLAPPLRDMQNEGNDPELAPMIKAILRRLARRNLLRGYRLSIPTGQSVAGAMGVEPLSTAELLQGNSIGMNAILVDNGFLERTPLWFYLLKEAEVRANGNSLGEVGSRLVCETIIGQLLNDSESYLNQPGGWDPSKGVSSTLPNGDPDLIVTIGDLLRFAGVMA